MFTGTQIKMERIIENLERVYKNFIDEKAPLIFVRGLAEYINFAKTTTPFGEVFADQMAERRVLIIEINQVVLKEREELDTAKMKLLSILKKSKIDVSSFERFATWHFREGTTILEELESFESGRSAGSRFISDEINQHLFDIAANLLNLGCGKDLKGFLVSQPDYAAYQRKMGSSVIDSEHGRFIFSKTLPHRHELVLHFERERLLKQWGSFEVLEQFGYAYDLAQRTLEFEYINENGVEKEPWFGGVKESINIVSMANEIQKLVANNFDFQVRMRTGGTTSNPSIRDIDLAALAQAARTAHSLLMRQDTKVINKKSEKSSLVIDPNKGLWMQSTPTKIYHVGGSRKKIIERLLKGTASLTELQKFYPGNFSDRKASNAVKEINDHFIEKTGKRNTKLIVKGENGKGYRLNEDVLDIQTE